MQTGEGLASYAYAHDVWPMLNYWIMTVLRIIIELLADDRMNASRYSVIADELSQHLLSYNIYTIIFLCTTLSKY